MNLVGCYDGERCGRHVFVHMEDKVVMIQRFVKFSYRVHLVQCFAGPTPCLSRYSPPSATIGQKYYLYTTHLDLPVVQITQSIP